MGAGPRAPLTELIQKWHHVHFVGGVVAQGVNQDKDHAAGERFSDRLTGRGWIVVQRRAEGVQRIHHAVRPEIRAGSDEETSDDAEDDPTILPHVNSLLLDVL